MRKLCATFEIVTPMFLGGADQEAKHIRGASIKGALAFWWRALNYERFVIEEKTGDAALSEAQVLEKALVKLQEREQELFGGPDGQGRFLLKVIPPKDIKILESGRGKILTKDGTIEGGDSFDSRTRETRNVIGVGGRYLGYGLMEAFSTKIDKDGEWLAKNVNSFAGQLTRSAIAQNQKFELQIIFRSKKNREDPSKKEDPLELEKDFQEIVKALKLFGLLGGLGSRVRRGWGSVSLIDLKGEGINFSKPETIEEYKNQLKVLIGTRKTNGSNFQLTAFTTETDIRVGKTPDDSALKTLNKIGEGFQRYRGWRNAGEKNFVDEHNWFKAGGDSNIIPQRTAFGLPHNYAKWLGVTASDENRDVKYDRRASPLMFHVHRLGNSQYVGVASFFPTKFLSNGEAAIWRGNTNNKTPIAYNFSSQGLPVIQNFLDGKKPDGSQNTPPYFSSTKLFP